MRECCAGAQCRYIADHEDLRNPRGRGGVGCGVCIASCGT